MTEATNRKSLRAVHALQPGQRIKPSLAAATVGAIFGADLLDALRRKGLLPDRDRVVTAAKQAKPRAVSAADRKCP